MQEGKLVPQGKHKAKLVGYQAKEGKNGTAYIEFTFKTENDELVWLKNYFTPKALPSTLKTYHTLGFTGDDPSQVLEREFGTGLFDEEFTYIVEVEHTEYNGKTYARAKWVNRPGS